MKLRKSSGTTSHALRKVSAFKVLSMGFMLALWLPSAPALAGATFYTNTDNENNAGTGTADGDLDNYLGSSSGIHPIEFNINVPSGLPASKAYLTIRANDVDEEAGEIDPVTFNGYSLGNLSGVNNEWSTTVLEVDPSYLVPGDNLVRISVASGWLVTVDWGQLVLDGGAADQGDTTNVAISSYSINSGTVTMNVDVEIQAINAGDFVLEVNLTDPNGNNSSVISDSITATAGQTLSRSYSPTYPLSGVSGTYQIEALLFYDNGSLLVQQDAEIVQFEHVQNTGPVLPASTLESTITATASDITADGVSFTSITVQARDGTGAALTSGGDSVTLSTDAGSLSTVTDNGDGTYTSTLTSSTTAGSATISGTINGYPIDDTAVVSFSPGTADATTSQISSALSALTADGSANTSITVQLVDANGNNLTSGGDTVTLATDSGTLSAVTDNGDGTYSAVLTASTTAGTATISGSVNGSPVTDTASLNYVAGAVSAGSSQIISAAPAITADGVSTTTITVQLTDANGNNITSGGDTVTLTTDNGTLSAVTDNGDGSYSATLTASTTAQTANISGSVNGSPITDTASVNFTTGTASAATSQITSASAVITADGTSTTTVTVQLVDANGNNLTGGGDSVTLATDNGALSGVVDNGDGTYTALLTAPTSTGTATISGTVNGAPANDTASVSFVPGAATTANSQISAAAGSITADGTSTTTVTVQLVDANGNNLTSGGDTVTLATDSGTLSTVTDNGDGTYSAILTASTTAGTATISGTVNGSPIASSTAVSFTVGSADASASLIQATPDSLIADGSSQSSIQITARDANGNPLATGGDSVTLSASIGNLGAVTDNGDGTYTATYTAPASIGDYSGSAVIILTINGQAGASDSIQLNVDPNEDADGDGIPNGEEGDLDSDQDSIPDYLDTDSDNDGLPDSLEGNNDTDNDGIPDSLDVDSDNDGLIDLLEFGVTLSGEDADSDGIDDAIDSDFASGEDLNGDGVIDSAAVDTDGDGTPDFQDVDSDNDGLPDALEQTLTGNDTDNDGLDDLYDVDSTGGTDSNGDGIDDAFQFADGDYDGQANHLDADADNDGISDGAESGATYTFDGVEWVMDDDDGDGIANVFDPDFTGGFDVNNDGVDDAAALPDTDNDGAENWLDLDSDNDGQLDVEEAGLTDANGDGTADSNQPPLTVLPDSDDDSIPDVLDLDSDNDGSFDIETGNAAGLDQNDDGQIDDASDADSDGIPDIYDAEPGQRGTVQDGDSDGVAAHVDQDDDDDGISDLVEGESDADGDGVVARLDKDSDGDGISDRFEAGIPDPLGTDTDLDGIDDRYDVDQTFGIDADADGIDDGFSGTDTDGDGLPDYLDTDSDNDGIPDNLEQLLVPPLNQDTDQDGIDDAYDVDVTGGEDLNGDGVDDSLMDLRDIDGDGLLNYLDTDSDGDGYSDAIENGDFDGDGIPDYLQQERGIETALDGQGGAFNIWLGMLAALLWAGRRGAVGIRLLALLALMMGSFSAQADPHSCRKNTAEERKVTADCLYLGGGFGYSFLEPDESATSWRQTDDQDTGYKLFIGYLLNDRWYAEIGYSDLGEAEFEHRNPAITGSETISYKIPNVSLSYQPFATGRFIVDPYVRVGLAKISNDASTSDLPFDELKGNQLMLGIGAHYRFHENWAVRAEFDSFDTDARYLGLSLVRYLQRN